MKQIVLTSHLTKKTKINYAEALNPEQLAVVLNGEEYVLVLAGAGSGKTRTVVYRVAYLLEQGINPAEILLVTFTNKAAMEMSERLKSLLGVSDLPLAAGTFHSLCHRWLRQIGSACGRDSNFTILDADDSKALISTIVKANGGADKGSGRPAPAVIQSLISFCKNSQATLEEVIKTRHKRWLPYQSWLQNIANEYERRKAESNAVDFDDLLTIFLQWLRADANNTARFAARFRYVLVDEFQDTNQLQAQIVELLSSQHRNLLVVGDDAQSIYSFRAADIQNILTFPERHPETKTYRLVANYRSTPEILNLANAIIAGNTDQFQKELISHCASGDKPTLISALDSGQEAQAIASLIEEQIKTGQLLSSMAVLFRATFHSQSLEFELTRRGIPYEYRGGQRFFERAHIKDLLAILRILTNPRDQVSWLRFLVLLPAIGEVAAQKIVASLIGHDWTQINSLTATVSGKGAASWQAVLKWLMPLAEKIYNVPPNELIVEIQKAWFDNYLEDNFPDARERGEDISQLSLVAAGYTDLNSFLAELSLQEGLAQGAEGQAAEVTDKLVLSTIHQAKGLEWSTVFVINLLEGAFPSQRSLGEPQGLSEERRLFYVAVTRAKTNLYLSYPLTGMGAGSFLGTPSTFVRELDEQLIERAELVRSPRVMSGSQTGRSTKSNYEDGPSYVAEDDGWGTNLSTLRSDFKHSKEPPKSYLF